MSGVRCDDPPPDARTIARYSLATHGTDSPVLRSVFAAHLTDPHAPARLEAAAGLALREDPRGDAVLAGSTEDAEPASKAGMGLGEVRRRGDHLRLNRP